MLAKGRPFSLDALARLYERERDRRAWDRQIAKLSTMKYAALTRLSKRIERILAGGKDGPEAACYRWADWYHPHVDAELDRRHEMKERLRTGRRRRGATVDEVLLLAEIADQRGTPPVQQGRKAARVSPQTRLPTIQADLFNTVSAGAAEGTAAHLLGFLYARKEASSR